MLNEDKVTEYNGYSIYRVESKDVYEVWKSGKQLGSFATEEDAIDFIKGELEEMKNTISKRVKKILEGQNVRSVIMEDEQEYWDYVHTYDYGVPGHEEELEKAADYFDVSPSAFEEDWYSFHRDDMIDSDDEFDALDEIDESKSQADLETELKKLETDDYQHRGGNYPKSDVADSIQVYGNEIECDFKNTDEETAKWWLEKFLKNHGFTFEKLEAWQDGDYADDWVKAAATVTGFKESKSVSAKTALTEGQKVYYGSLYRFGYDMNCIDKSKKACEQAIMDEYEEVFKRQNGGMDPRESFEHDDKKSDYDIAKSDIEWDELEFGKVSWR